MKTLIFILFFAPLTSMAKDLNITVHRTPTCGCCGKWVDILKENGFKVTVEMKDQEKLNQVKKQYGITPKLASCHTGIIDGYAIEGHVPPKDIKKFLTEKPKAAGLSVPQMPVGSPGMEMGSRKDPFDVISFTKSGKTKVYNSYNK